ncbi:MAG: hypothetical protein JSV01_04545 [Desulfobacterales bacterium]|nr:MAG: hypothetical protein JSV01_04545 [Desulfobacterales bacterium]
MATKMKGVTCIERNGTLYYYARVGGQRVYCGKGDKGLKLAEAARAKEIAKRYENREMIAGLKVKKVDLKTVKDLANSYMTLPTVPDQRSYSRNVLAVKNVLDYFGTRPVHASEADEQERYRKLRRDHGAADATIDVEISVLSAMYHEARKCKKVNPDAMPGQFVIKAERNPRRIVTDEEFEKLVDKADPDFRDVLICAYESAMRSSEIARLTAG